jgi:hypothetical protein
LLRRMIFFSSLSFLHVPSGRAVTAHLRVLPLLCFHPLRRRKNT